MQHAPRLADLRMARSISGALLRQNELDGFGGASPHAVRPRTARTIQINKHAPMNPAMR
jgi:hypothetical protein